MILDSNVVIALIHQPDSPVNSWLFSNRGAGPRINPIIFAEVSPNFALSSQLEDFLLALDIDIEPLALEECHLAGRAFKEFRRRGGERTTILPDFLIGAQAAMRGWPLVTRDRKGFASYFPDLQIIDPLEDFA